MDAFNILSVFLFFFLVWLYCAPSEALKFEYHNEKELESVLRNFTNETKNIHTKMYSIGFSAHRKTPLWVMQLSGANKSKPGIPNIKFVANIHGNEAVGREILLHFMEYLRDEYEKNELVKCLLDNSNIHLLPCMNPDGFAVANQGVCEGEYGRANGKRGNRDDLNRNFPDFYHTNGNQVQPETTAVMNWMAGTPFILSAGLHGGAMVANYPFDTEEIEKTLNDHASSLTPDDDVFRNLASVYAINHPKMNKSRCEDDKPTERVFKNGITNGAAWYSFQGGMQDYNYYKYGCMEITLEISCCKYPRASELSKLWKQNKQALLMYSLEALKGVAGQVLDGISKKPIRNANLKIVGRNMTFKSSESGYFWRILLPGTYKIMVVAPGYYTATESFRVETTKNQCPQPTRLLIFLTNSSISTIAKSTTINDIKDSKKKDSLFPRIGRSNILREASMGSPQPKIVNGASAKWPLSPKDEEEIFLMLFGPPRDFKGTNITEKDIREFMQKDLGINDTKKFDPDLEKFDSKTYKEKIGIILNLGKKLKDVAEIFTNEKSLREYMAQKLGIVNFGPYEDILNDFDRKNVTEKKIALAQLIEKFELILSPTNATVISTESKSTTPIYYASSNNSAHSLRYNSSLHFMMALVVSNFHILFYFMYMSR